MSIAIYRKYRPKSFKEVSGQNHIKMTLQNELEFDNSGHAYLFCGPRGTGKTTLARLLAKSVNCLNLQKDGEPCNECDSCQELINNKSMDVVEIDAASNNGVDNVRENIINNARFTPTSRKYKVFIIDEVHMMTTPAFNALLKTLEEPPQYVIFILATTEIHKVPVTIISRCQRFDFHKVRFNDLIERLKWILVNEKVEVDEMVLKNIAKQSGGCVRDAESLLEQVLSIGGNKITTDQAQLILPRNDYELIYNLFVCFMNKNTKEGIEIINQLVRDGVDVNQFTNSLVEFIRKVLLYKISGEKNEFVREIDENVATKVDNNLEKYSQNNLTAVIEILLQTKELFKQNYIAQLPLEMALVKYNQEVPVFASKQKVEESHDDFFDNKKNVNPNFDKPLKDKQDEKVSSSMPQDEKIDKNLNSDASSDDKPKVETVSSTNSEKPSIKSKEINDVVAFWPSVLNFAKQKSYQLYMTLRMSKPIKVENNTLFLGFMFELQKGKIDDINNKNIVKEILKQNGFDVEIETVIDSNLNSHDFSNSNGTSSVKKNNTLDDSVNEIADQFGGEVLD